MGRLGTASLGAVGLSTLLFVFSNLFFNFLTVVTTSNVAGAYAVNDEQEVRTSAPFVFWFVDVPSSVCLTVAAALMSGM